MEIHGASAKNEFGKDACLMSEVIVTGRKVGADREFWAAIAHDRVLFQKVADFVKKEKAAFAQKQIDEWVKLYCKDGIEVDFSNLWIPNHQKGIDRLIVIPSGLKIQQALDNCAKHFSVLNCLHCNLDEIVIKNDRDPANGAYAIWVRNRVEADKELKNFSANDLEKKKIPGITLLERIQYERKYCEETGKHLDNITITLCSGSRDSAGLVPCVYWSVGEMRVLCYDPDDSDGDLRARSAVST